MIEQINVELLKLQEELKKLKSASEQIAHAGKLSKDVVELGQNLTEKYSDVLKKLQSLVSDYMNKTYKLTEENLTKLFMAFQERLKEEEGILSKFSELSAQSEDLVKKVVDTIVEDNKKLVDNLIKEVNTTLDKQRKLLEEYTNKSVKSLDSVAQEHQKNLEKEQKVLESYLELAEKTAQLTKVIESVNFPKRLDNIDNKLSSLNTRVNEAEKNVKDFTADQTDQILTKINQVLIAQEELYEKVERNRKKITGAKTVLWILFILNLIFYILATTGFLRIFTDFFDSFCK